MPKPSEKTSDSSSATIHFYYFKCYTFHYFLVLFKLSLHTVAVPDICLGSDLICFLVSRIYFFIGEEETSIAKLDGGHGQISPPPGSATAYIYVHAYMYYISSIGVQRRHINEKRADSLTLLCSSRMVFSLAISILREPYNLRQMTDWILRLQCHQNNTLKSDTATSDQSNASQSEHHISIKTAHLNQNSIF